MSPLYLKLLFLPVANAKDNTPTFPLNRRVKARRILAFLRNCLSVFSRQFRISAITMGSVLRGCSVCLKPQRITSKVSVTLVSFVSRILSVTSGNKFSTLLASDRGVEIRRRPYQSLMQTTQRLCESLGRLHTKISIIIPNAILTSK